MQTIMNEEILKRLAKKLKENGMEALKDMNGNEIEVPSEK